MNKLDREHIKGLLETMIFHHKRLESNNAKRNDEIGEAIHGAKREIAELFLADLNDGHFDEKVES